MREVEESREEKEWSVGKWKNTDVEVNETDKSR